MKLEVYRPEINHKQLKGKLYSLNFRQKKTSSWTKSQDWIERKGKKIDKSHKDHYYKPGNKLALVYDIIIKDPRKSITF